MNFLSTDFLFGRALSSLTHKANSHSGSRYSLQVRPRSTSPRFGLFATIAHAFPCTPIISVLLFVLPAFLISCSTDPEPLVYGTDICHFCKMTMMDNKFGAELVTKKGKIFKFDDMNCFLNFYNSEYENVEDFHHKLVIDYANPGKLIDATNGFYLKSAAIRSPMNGQVAAFETKASMDTFKKEWKAIYLGWGEVTTQYK